MTLRRGQVRSRPDACGELAVIVCGATYTASMPVTPPSTPAARSARLASVRAEIRGVTTQRLARPGGLRDARLRDRLEDLQGEEHRLCLELGLPARHPEPRAFGWVGWLMLLASITAVVSVLYLVN
jgi:hypothetical protein